MAGKSCFRFRRSLQPGLVETFRAVLTDIVSSAPPIAFQYFLCPYSATSEIFGAYWQSVDDHSLLWPVLLPRTANSFKLLYFVAIMDFLQTRLMLKKLKKVQPQNSIQTPQIFKLSSLVHCMSQRSCNYITHKEVLTESSELNKQWVLCAELLILAYYDPNT